MPVNTQQTKISAFFKSRQTSEDRPASPRSNRPGIIRDGGAEDDTESSSSSKLRTNFVVIEDSNDDEVKLAQTYAVNTVCVASQLDSTIASGQSVPGQDVEGGLISSAPTTDTATTSIRTQQANPNDRESMKSQPIDETASGNDHEQDPGRMDTSYMHQHSSEISCNSEKLSDTKYSIERIPAEHLKAFKRLLNTLLPVNYSPSFFQSIQDTRSALAREVRWQTSPGRYGPTIGGIKGKLQEIPVAPRPDGSKVRESQLYIQAIGVLAPYRRFGIAGALLEEVEREAMGLNLETEDGKHFGRVTSTCAHVWEANEEALEWYKRRGFVVERKEDEYYHKLRPQGAWLIRRLL